MLASCHGQVMAACAQALRELLCAPFFGVCCVVALCAVLAHKKMACLQVLVCGMGEGLWPWPVCVGSAHLYSTGRCAVCVVSVSFSPPSGLGIHLYRCGRNGE